MINVHDIRIVIVPERFSVPAVIQPPYLISCLQHIIDGFSELLYGFRKSVADHDNTFRILGTEMFIIDRLAFHTLKISAFPALGNVRFHFCAHDFGIVFFLYPIHVASSCHMSSDE